MIYTIPRIFCLIVIEPSVTRLFVYLRLLPPLAKIVAILIKMFIVSMKIPTDSLIGSNCIWVSAFLTIFWVSYNRNMLNRIKPPYRDIEYKLRPSFVVGGKKALPNLINRNEINIRKLGFRVIFWSVNFKFYILKMGQNFKRDENTLFLKGHVLKPSKQNWKFNIEKKQ